MIVLPTDAADALRSMRGQLDRHRSFLVADGRLVGEIAEEKAAGVRIRGELDEIEGRIAVADATGDQTLFDKLTRERGTHDQRRVASEEAIARKERSRRSLATQTDKIAPEIETALPPLRQALTEIGRLAMHGLRDLFVDAIAGKGRLIVSVMTAYMLHDAIGQPGREFLNQIRIPDPTAPVAELPMMVGAAGFSNGGDAIQARWLLSRRGVVVEKAEPGEFRSWRDDKALVALYEQLAPFKAAIAEAEPIVRRLNDRRAREHLLASDAARSERIAPHYFVPPRASA